MNNKLQGKDLINIGIFTAIYFIVIFAAASIGLYSDFHSAYQRDSCRLWAVFR